MSDAAVREHWEQFEARRPYSLMAALGHLQAIRDILDRGDLATPDRLRWRAVLKTAHITNEELEAAQAEGAAMLAHATHILGHGSHWIDEIQLLIQTFDEHLDRLALCLDAFGRRLDLDLESRSDLRKAVAAFATGKERGA